MRRLKLKSGWWLAIIATVTLTACGSDQVDEEVLKDLDPPQINYIDDEEELSLEVMEGEEIGEPITDMDGDGSADEGEPEEKGGPVSETAMMELYLVDRNGLVSPQSLNIPKGENDVEQVIEYLVQGGPINNVLPNGFQAVLPAGTEVLDASISSDGVAVVNLSSQFAEYHPNQEMQILQSLTWTVTQLENVNRLKLQMDGEDLEMMPKQGTPISGGYTRGHGINLEMSDEVDLVGTKSIVVYFLSQSDDQTYYVPVTRRVPENHDVYQAVVNELLKGPNVMTSLFSDFRREVELLENPSFANGTLTLNFNEALLSQMEGKAISQDVLNMLVLSLTEQQEVQNVTLQVESEGNLLVSTGETITKPVSRPNMVNTGEY